MTTVDRNPPFLPLEQNGPFGLRREYRDFEAPLQSFETMLSGASSESGAKNVPAARADELELKALPIDGAQTAMHALASQHSQPPATRSPYAAPTLNQADSMMAAGSARVFGSETYVPSDHATPENVGTNAVGLFLDGSAAPSTPGHLELPEVSSAHVEAEGPYPASWRERLGELLSPAAIAHSLGNGARTLGLNAKTLLARSAGTDLLNAIGLDARLLSAERHDALAKHAVLTASFSETGTLGFERGTTSNGDDALQTIPPRVAEELNTHILDNSWGKSSTTLEPAQFSYSSHDTRESPIVVSNLGRRAMRIAAPAQRGAPTFVPRAMEQAAADSPESVITRLSTSKVARITDALSTLGSGVSISLELIGDTLRIHIHLPVCAEDERQKLSERAQDILDAIAPPGAELVVHERPIGHHSRPRGDVADGY